MKSSSAPTAAPAALPSLQAICELPAPAVALQWLTLALGEDEATEALQLPQHLLISLYGDVLAYGPAANQIVGVAAVMVYPHMPGEEEREARQALQATLHALGEHLETLWSNIPDMVDAHDRFYTATWDMVLRDEAFLLLCWILTVSYFTPSLLSGGFQALIEPAQKLLRVMDLPDVAEHLSRFEVEQH